jgi:hypothetical protein
MATGQESSAEQIEQPQQQDAAQSPHSGQQLDQGTKRLTKGGHEEILKGRSESVLAQDESIRCVALYGFTSQRT